MEALKTEIEQYLDQILAQEWADFAANIQVKTAQKRETILRQSEVCTEVLYLLDGIAASEFNTREKYIISRFFQPGNFCSNLVSAVTQTIQPDNVVAITRLSYVSIPFANFMELYLHSDSIGLYIRKKMMELLVEDKHFISLKTTTSTTDQYIFMEQHYPEILQQTPARYIAAFMGITPEALSRFLKSRLSS